jgi:hypothetical protein
MIELVKELPDHVVGIVATGRVTNRECGRVLVPALQATLKRHRKIRLYYEINSRFPGAGWENLTAGDPGSSPWERIAIVTDVGWVRHCVNALRFLIPAEIRVFASVQASEARTWISALPEIDAAA